MAVREAGRRALALPAGQVVEVRVRVSDRARTSRIVVAPSVPPEVVVPSGTSPTSIDDLLSARSGWIEEKLALMRARAAAPRVGFAGPGWIRLSDARVPVAARDGGAARAERTDRGIVARGPDAAARARALERLLRREARAVLGRESEIAASRLGLAFRRITIRDQRRRWGSCSSRGVLSYSWRLLLAPERVRTYVVLHEVVHLAIPNHSRAFWDEMARIDPSHPEAVSWLRRHGEELRATDLADSLAATGDRLT